MQEFKQELFETPDFIFPSAETHSNITVQACFESDRTSLGEVGNYLDPDLLCIPKAKEKEMIEWAKRSISENAFLERPLGRRGTGWLTLEEL